MASEPQSTNTTELVEQKLAAFERIQEEFEANFLFIGNVHGRQRFPETTVADIVHYLHARWIDECKTSLLSVAKTVKEYDGRYCLELLKRWQQEGDVAGVVEFLYRKLETRTVVDVAREVQLVSRTPGKEAILRGMLNGRRLMINRGFNLLHFIDTLFQLSPDELADEVHKACRQYQHLPTQIERQLAEMDTALYSYVPHQLLAQRNMQVMNRLLEDTAEQPGNLPSEHTEYSGNTQHAEAIDEKEGLEAPLAEGLIEGYHDMTSTSVNNPIGEHFIDPGSDDSK
jgi:hypothetical protein